MIKAIAKLLLIYTAMLLSSCTKEYQKIDTDNERAEFIIIYNGEPDEPTQEYTVSQ